MSDLYEIDGVPVDEEAYQAKWKAPYEDQPYVLIGYEDGIPINEEEIRKLRLR